VGSHESHEHEGLPPSEDPAGDSSSGEQPSLAGFVRYLQNGVSSSLRRVRDFVEPVLGFGRRRSDTPGAAARAARTRVYFDVKVDDQYIGRINMELFDEVVPKTVENFRQLVTGKKN